MTDPAALHHSSKDPVLPTPRQLGAVPGTGPGSLQRGRPVPRVTVRTLTEDDVPDLAACSRPPAGTSRPGTRSAPGSTPPRTPGVPTSPGCWSCTGRGVAPRYLRIAGRRQDHLLLSLLADETATPGMR